MSKSNQLPIPIFDTLENLIDNKTSLPGYVIKEDFDIAREFLLAYRGSSDTFNSYRRECEKLLQWLYLVARKSLKEVDRTDVENFIRYCQRPPVKWIATKVVSKYVIKNGKQQPNPSWRPFVAKVSKTKRRDDLKPSAKDYFLSNSATAAVMRIISTFFSFLEAEDYVTKNPVKRIRQKSQFTRRKQQAEPVRRLSNIQWDYVIETAEIMASKETANERTLFIMSILYGMYLRISEVVETERWAPMMQHFYQDIDNNWWFKTVGKRNKERDVSVSTEVLNALKRYRRSIGLSSLPLPGDSLPLIQKLKGKGGISSTRQVRDIVQECFDQALVRMKQDGMKDSDIAGLRSATVHWLRHTGISEDVKIRPKEHVRDDAGHSSSATTDRYIDIEQRERHASARKKKLRPI
jgi:site-specific recombinase XerD